MGLIDEKQVDKTGWNDNTFLEGYGNDVDIDIYNPLQPTTYIVVSKRKPPYEYILHFSSYLSDDLSIPNTIDGREHKVVIANIDTEAVEVNGYLSTNEVADGSIYRQDWGTISLEPSQVMTIRYFWVQVDVRYCIVDYVIT